MGEDSLWATVGLQVITGITVGVTSGLILAIVAFLWSRYRRRQVIKMFDDRVREAKHESSITKIQEDLDTILKNHPDLTVPQLQFDLFKAQLKDLQILLDDRGNELDPEKRVVLRRWLVSQENLLQNISALGKIPGSPQAYEGFWHTLEEMGWSD